MSLTNPNTPVSQQDLKDFYDKIKPYLGIYPPMVANKFSKGDLYSTDEKMIGQWTDGKPLYQRTFHLTNPTGEWVANSLGFTADKVFLVDTCYTANWMGGCSYYSSSSNMASIFAYKDTNTNDVSIWIRSTSTITDLYVTLRYTKTTDSAISIGDETDYSTTEKIVGTWIDGSPVYQKTFKFKLTALKTEISIGASVEDAFVTYGYVNNGAGYLLPKALYLSGDMYINSGVHKSNNTVYIETNINELIGKDCVLVVQYTKTT